VAIPVAFNEERAIGRVLDRFQDVKEIDLAVVDDGSTDATPRLVEERGVALIRRARQGGAGAAIRAGYAWARANNYDICVILSGNDKDRPDEMPLLVDPIARGEADVVQGSRYLGGGQHHNMPRHRRLASQYAHPWLFSLAAGQRMTDTTNGYRALRLSLLDDPRLDLDQPWLDAYDLEPYLLLRAIRLGYVVREVPVSKVYPPRGQPYTKMRPVTDWWSILRPIALLGLGLKK
jgi:dolichol-phosphate mannosyltransferase